MKGAKIRFSDDTIGVHPGMTFTSPKICLSAFNQGPFVDSVADVVYQLLIDFRNSPSKGESTVHRKEIKYSRTLV